jgi:calcineurin-like phosphoesterase family protein
MNEALIANWNAVVGPNDIVYHMGDFIMGTFMDNVSVIDRLNGSIVLTPGNHDRMSSVYHDKPARKERFTFEYKTRGVTVLPEHWQVIAGIYGDHYSDMGILEMSHYPYAGDSHEEDRFPEMRPADNGNWLIHGHVHEAWKINGRMINVGVDVWDFTPVHIDQIREIINA